MTTFTDDFGQELLGVHAASACIGPCPIHKPSDHHMREWKLMWRNDLRAFERICPHGIGHPDPDDIAYALWPGRGIHSCDGCCQKP